MPPKRGTKRAAEDQTYTNKKSTLKQKKFTPRLKAIKENAVVSTTSTAERPRKRRKSQTTMTQLDFGKRSYLEAICDSDDEDEEIKSEDDIPSSGMKRKRTPVRRSKLPGKTESQDTLTQMGWRGGDMIVIGDSEDEELLSDADVSDAEEEKAVEVVEPSASKPAEEMVEEEETTDTPQEGTRDQATAKNQQPPPSKQLPPRTPKRVRVLPVPSSRSPPDSHLSTQVTPRHVHTQDPRSPLQERSVNIQARAMVRSDLPKELGSSPVKATPKRTSPLKSILRSARKEPAQIEKPQTQARSSPLKSILASTRKQAKQAEGSQTQTRRRVREFNARFAALDRETSDMRRRRSAVPDMPAPRPVRPAAETQYSMPGDDTQAAWMELPFVSTAEEQPFLDEEEGKSQEVVKCSPVVDDGGDVPADAPPAMDSVEQVSESPVKEATSSRESSPPEEVLIPSSPSKKSRRAIASSQADEDESPELPDESLPESPYPAASARSAHSKKDSQELASDQLMRETQQAFMYRVPSSQRSSQRKATQVRPSQATTVDETMTYSSFTRTQRRLGPTQPSQKLFKPLEMVSSSPVSDQIILQPIPSSSSPLQQPPGLAVATSSSPRMQEPKTPTILRHLKRPLRMEDLVGESLDMGAESMGMPPRWEFGDSVGGAMDEESDDGEL